MARVVKNNRDKVMADATKAVSVVTCVRCGRMHLVDSDGFVVVYGNITAGLETPILGDNINERGVVVGSTIFCRSKECLSYLMLLLRGETTPEQQNT